MFDVQLCLAASHLVCATNMYGEVKNYLLKDTIEKEERKKIYDLL